MAKASRPGRGAKADPSPATRAGDVAAPGDETAPVAGPLHAAAVDPAADPADQPKVPGTEADPADPPKVPGTEADAPAESAPEPRVEPALASPVRSAPQGGRVLPLILGGALAAGIGGAAMWVLAPRLAPPIDIATELAPLHARIADLEAEVRALRAQPSADPQAFETRLQETQRLVQAGLDALAAQTRDQITAVTAQTQDSLPDLTAATQAALAVLDAELRARVADLTDEVTAAATRRLSQAEAATETARAAAALAEARAQALQSDLQASESRADRVAALADLAQAAASDSPAPEALDRLAATGDVPPALGALREGLMPMQALQDGFPAAARAALAAIPVPADAPVTDRVIGFLRAQTGARSLAPRAGDDPDAILARAEAALRAGDLSGALREIDGLPAPAAQAMAPWRRPAQERADAIAALDALVADLNRP
jgi:hypothetical protein